MNDLSALLQKALRDQPPASAPPLAGLLRRAQARRRVGTTAIAVSVGLVVTTASIVVLHRDDRSGAISSAQQGAGFIDETVTSSSAHQIVLEAPIGQIRWTLDQDCSISFWRLPPAPRGGGGMGGRGCPSAPRVSIGINSESFGFPGSLLTVLAGRVDSPPSDRIRVTLSNGTQTEVEPTDGYWMVVVERCGDFAGTAFEHVALINTIGDTVGGVTKADKGLQANLDVSGLCALRD